MGWRRRAKAVGQHGPSRELTRASLVKVGELALVLWLGGGPSGVLGLAALSGGVRFAS